MELAPALLANRRKPSSSAGDIPQGAIMSTSITHETATTKFAEADGVHYAYRRFGGPSDAPLVFCHRFRGTMDDWDPAQSTALPVSATLFYSTTPASVSR